METRSRKRVRFEASAAASVDAKKPFVAAQPVAAEPEADADDRHLMTSAPIMLPAIVILPNAAERMAAFVAVPMPALFDAETQEHVIALFVSLIRDYPDAPFMSIMSAMFKADNRLWSSLMTKHMDALLSACEFLLTTADGVYHKPIPNADIRGYNTLGDLLSAGVMPTCRRLNALMFVSRLARCKLVGERVVTSRPIVDALCKCLASDVHEYAVAAGNTVLALMDDHSVRSLMTVDHPLVTTLRDLFRDKVAGGMCFIGGCFFVIRALDTLAGGQRDVANMLFAQGFVPMCTDLLTRIASAATPMQVPRLHSTMAHLLSLLLRGQQVSDTQFSDECCRYIVDMLDMATSDVDVQINVVAVLHYLTLSNSVYRERLGSTFGAVVKIQALIVGLFKADTTPANTDLYSRLAAVLGCLIDRCLPNLLLALTNMDALYHMCQVLVSTTVTKQCIDFTMNAFLLLLSGLPSDKLDATRMKLASIGLIGNLLRLLRQLPQPCVVSAYTGVNVPVALCVLKHMVRNHVVCSTLLCSLDGDVTLAKLVRYNWRGLTGFARACS
jgi:hypothetical protein